MIQLNLLNVIPFLLNIFLSGDLRDIGAGKGKYYAVNIPLRDGMDDESYESIFVPIISKVMETFQPSAVVLQCGADSLTGKFMEPSTVVPNLFSTRDHFDFFFVSGYDKVK